MRKSESKIALPGRRSRCKCSAKAGAISTGPDGVEEETKSMQSMIRWRPR